MPDSGYRLELLPSKPLKRKISPQIILFALYTFASFWSALFLIRREKPDVVIGMGGYASFAPIVAAAMYGLPRLLHEQNAIPGLSNRILAKFCSTIAVSYPDSKTFFKKKVGIFLTGNPVRKKILSPADKVYAKKSLGLKDKFTVLFFGGSRGAAKINKAVVAAAPKLIENLGIQLIHITGTDDYQHIKNKADEYNDIYKVFKFYGDMGLLYKASDLVLSRAGATTVAEITATGSPAIFVPYPYATADHQFHNAKMLEYNNAAVIIPDKDLTADNVFNKIRELVMDKVRLKEMSSFALNYGKPDAAYTLAKLVLAEIRMKP